jgi:hypothetical protein
MSTKFKKNLIIAGVHKAATTSLYEYLIQHNDICSGKTKEIHRYTPLRYGKAMAEMSLYEQQFKDCKEKIYFLDASPSYLYGKEEIASAIKTDFLDSRIIIIIREPAARFVSFFKFIKTGFRLSKEVVFSEFVEKSYALKSEPDKDDLFYRAYREGEYVDYLQPWIETFGEALKIVFFDDIKNNQKKVMIDLCAWLNIKGDIYMNMDFDIKNKTRTSKYRVLHSIASSINNNFEYFFRNNPSIKNRLNKIYFILNGSKNEEKITADEIKNLKKLYEQKNMELSELLIKNGYQDLPKWLKKDK